MRFSKWHALGNDYLLVERPDAGELTATAVRRLCDRHTGVGADGILEVVASERGRVELVIRNPDGSHAELSGNGTRIAARWLARRDGLDAVAIVVGAREEAARLRGELLVEQSMGRVVVGIEETVDVGGEALALTPVSIGNPHAVIRRDPGRAELVRIGPLVERHPRFPERTNVQLVRVEGLHDLTVGVWERGAGETRSSGTSACAAAAAAIAAGWCASPVTVHLPGGDLWVAIDGDWEVTLTGPAQEICAGEVAPDLLHELER
jgi:diaminopimelate epimerase